jgi:hypothetical protein
MFSGTLDIFANQMEDEDENGNTYPNIPASFRCSAINNRASQRSIFNHVIPLRRIQPRSPLTPHHTTSSSVNHLHRPGPALAVSYKKPPTRTFYSRIDFVHSLDRFGLFELSPDCSSSKSSLVYHYNSHGQCDLGTTSHRSRVCT